MKSNHYKRIIEIVTYFILEQSTVRATAKEFGISKSAVYVYLTKTILDYGEIELYKEASKQLRINKNERHIRGGMATKNKYLYPKKK